MNASTNHVARIVNAKVFDGGDFIDADVVIEGGMIAAVKSDKTSSDDETTGIVLDGSGKYLIPGLIDVHFHGAVGSDFCDGTKEAFDNIARYEASSGVTTICPATMTYSHEILSNIMKAAKEYHATFFEGNTDRASFAGINMEGPFISPNKVGAQNPEYVRCPDYDEFVELQELSGNLIKIVDIAAEEDNAIEFTKRVSKTDCVVSLAHTTASYDQALALFNAGATHVTHLFNAMPGINHRNPGPIIAAAESPQVSCELICDGIHLHPAIVRFAFELFGSDRIVLISDSMRATGMDDGTYDLGGQNVNKEGRRATLADGTIAGSVSNVYDCMRWSVQEAGVPLAEAVKCATINPAKSIGIFDEVGSIEAAKKADLLLVDQDLNLDKVIIGGQVLQ